MSAAADTGDADWLFGGKLALRQPARGHRAGTDAVLLAAAAGASARHAVDLGAGIGTIGLAIAVLGRAERVTLVERDAGMAALARDNVALNGLNGRVDVVETDLTGPARMLTEKGLAPASADLVIANPPYNDPVRHRPSPDPSRLAAHAMTAQDMAEWIKTAARLLKGDGRLVLIHRPEALPWLLPLLERSFGGLGILPVHARVSEPAKRVLIQGRLDSRAPARLLPALVLHESDGRYTPRASALHAGEEMLAF